ncbi:MAG: hypothetical protein KC609_04460 [Myxococcales bacterium]|nr:hypothetical protein [Myxococcales bacterium]
MNRRFSARRARYLERYGRGDRWRLQSPPSEPVDIAVVVPVYDEVDQLDETLAALESSIEVFAGRGHVVLVVNEHRESPEAAKASNRAALRVLGERWRAPWLGLVDAASEGLAFDGVDEGVGLARRIGADLLLPYCAPRTVLAHLDADTRVPREYLSRLVERLSAAEPRAAVLDFRHRVVDPRLGEAVRTYERFLKTTAARLAAIGSPYGYVALGSAMASNVAAYLDVRGVPVRAAGEDFYFLQKLAKSCGVVTLDELCVEPAARLSKRVPFGTGRRLEAAQNGVDPSQLFYDEPAFELFAAFRRLARGAFDHDGQELRRVIGRLNPMLPALLERQGLLRRWEKLRRSAAEPRRFAEQFDRWYDALKTLQFLRYVSLHHSESRR